MAGWVKILDETAPLSDIGDVTITSITSGEALAWTGSAWENQTLAELGVLPIGGGTLTGTLTTRDVVVQSTYKLKFDSGGGGDALLKGSSGGSLLLRDYADTDYASLTLYTLTASHAVHAGPNDVIGWGGGGIRACMTSSSSDVISMRNTDNTAYANLYCNNFYPQGGISIGTSYSYDIYGRIVIKGIYNGCGALYDMYGTTLAVWRCAAPGTDSDAAATYGWLQNGWVVGQTVLASGVDSSNDKLTIYDASASAMKSVTPAILNAALDHGTLTGLTDDDHTQYLLRDDLAWKTPVRVVGTTNITRSATQTIDGVSLGVGDRILLTAETAAQYNGVWIVAAGTWSRATDMNVSAEFFRGIVILASEGTAGAGTLWRYDTATAGFTLDTTTQTWTQISTGSSATASAWKEPVRAVSTANVTRSGTMTIDGVSLAATDRVLLVGQSLAEQNGIFVVAAGAWSRSTDLDVTGEFYAGVMVPVAEGTEGIGRVYRLATPAPITVDTTTLSFVQAVADSNRFFGSGTEINSRVLISPLPSTGNFTCVSGTAYAVYLGRTTVARVWKYIEFELRTVAGGSQAAELGLFSTPNPPSKAGQTLTELESTSTVDTMVGGVPRMIRNTGAFAGTVAAGTHLWAVFRCAMGTTQPVTGGHSSDMGQGWLLTATPGSIAGIGSYSGSLITFAINQVSPALRITAD